MDAYLLCLNELMENLKTMLIIVNLKSMEENEKSLIASIVHEGLQYGGKQKSVALQVFGCYKFDDVSASIIIDDAILK